MNLFQSTASGQGMLKDVYDAGGADNTAEALKRRRKKMLAKKELEVDDLEPDDNEQQRTF